MAPPILISVALHPAHRIIDKLPLWNQHGGSCGDVAMSDKPCLLLKLLSQLREVVRIPIQLNKLRPLS
ncbi:hypothetical protein D3C81_2327980 [compost metagenome]